MNDFNIFIDGSVDPTRPQSGPTFQIAICPVGRGASALGSRAYSTKEALAKDLRAYLGFNDAAIDAYFAQLDMHQALVHHLSDEVATYFGWPLEREPKFETQWTGYLPS